MAKIKAYGIDELVLSMADLANIPDSVLDEMLSKGADEAIEGHKASLRAHGLVKTGTLMNSLKKVKKIDKDGQIYYLISPKGTHHTNKDGSRIRNAEVGFISEFGAPKKGISGKQWMQDGNEKTADKVTAAEFSVYDNYLKSKNL